MNTRGEVEAMEGGTVTPLDAFGRWAVRSNLERIASGEAAAGEIIATLRANGYPSWADAVAERVELAVAERDRRAAWARGIS